MHSEHPLARTILEEARVKNIAVPKYSSVDYLPGRGIAARVNGDEIVLGTAMLMNERAMAGGANNDYLSRSSEETGMTEVFVAIKVQSRESFNVPTFCAPRRCALYRNCTPWGAKQSCFLAIRLRLRIV